MILGGPDYFIQGHVLKIYLLVCILLDALARFHQFVRSGLFAEVKLQKQPDLFNHCGICGGKLGDWYHTTHRVPTHYICEYPKDKNGVLI